MINVVMPANCQMLFSFIVKVATFDLIPVDGIMDSLNKIMPTDTNEYEIQQNWIEFGYESTNPVQNLEIIFIFMVGLMLLPAIIWIVGILSSCVEKAK